MCSMWVPAVLGEMTSRAATSLFEAHGDQAEDLDLPASQSGGTADAARRPVAGDTQDGFHRLAVEPSGANVVTKLGRGFVVRAGPAVWSRLEHRLVHVGGGENPCGTGDGRARQAAGIAGTVEVFAYLHRDLPERGERGRTPQHPLGQVRVQPDALPLRCRQRAGLVPDRVRHPEVAEARHQRGAPHGGDLVVRRAERGRRTRCQLGNRSRVTDRVRRLEVDESADRGERLVAFSRGQRA